MKVDTPLKLSFLARSEQEGSIFRLIYSLIKKEMIKYGDSVKRKIKKDKRSVIGYISSRAPKQNALTAKEIGQFQEVHEVPATHC